MSCAKVAEPDNSGNLPIIVLKDGAKLNVSFRRDHDGRVHFDYTTVKEIGTCDQVAEVRELWATLKQTPVVSGATVAVVWPTDQTGSSRSYDFQKSGESWTEGAMPDCR